VDTLSDVSEPWASLWPRVRLARVALTRGDPAQARMLLATGQAVAAASGGPRHRAAVHQHLGALHRWLGEPDQAAAHYARGAGLAREIDDALALALNLVGLGTVVVLQGDAAGAQAPLAEGLALCTGLGWPWGRAMALHALGLAASGEGGRVRAHHAAYYLALAEAAAPELRGARGAVWLARLRRDLDNVRAALAWAEAQGEAELGLRLAAALLWVWAWHHREEGRAWLTRLLALPAPAPGAVRVKALNAAGLVAGLLGEREEGRAHREAALALARETGDAAGTGWALLGLGLDANARGEQQAGAPADDGVHEREEHGGAYPLRASWQMST
jgi:hypothetical protein